MRSLDLREAVRRSDPDLAGFAHVIDRFAEEIDLGCLVHRLEHLGDELLFYRSRFGCEFGTGKEPGHAGATELADVSLVSGELVVIQFHLFAVDGDLARYLAG